MADIKHLETAKPIRDGGKPNKVSRNRIRSPLEVFEKYICPFCENLLNEAVQSACGHRMCRSCVDDAFRQ